MEKEEKKVPVENKKKDKDSKADKELVKNTIDLNPSLNEQSDKTVVLGWGRMNPVTVGHEKLADKIKSVAKSNRATPLLYLSHSQDPKKNPLSYNDKISLARKAFGPMVQKSQAKTIIDAMKELQSRFNKVILIVGSDRVKQFQDLLTKYNGKEYNFESIEVVSAGERDPDAEDVTGMSASKMRAAAASGDMEAFKKGLPSKLKSMSQNIYDTVRSGMKLAEELEELGLLDEAPLTIAQRRKRALTMRRYKSKLAIGRKRRARMKANPERLKQRARKKAIDVIRKRVAGARGKSYKEMTPSEKIEIDRKVQKRKAAIERIAKKLLPQVRKAEMIRLQGGSKVNEEFEAMFEDYYKGVPQHKKDDRRRHFEKHAKMDDDNPAAYKPAPGDKDVETKTSKHTKKYRKMYGEENEPVQKKRFHELLKKDGSVKYDKRFKINRKMNEQTSDEVERVKDQHTREKNRMRQSHERELDRAKIRAVRSKTSMRNKPIRNEEIELENDIDLLNLVNEIHESLELSESKTMEGLKKKAEKTGMPYSVLKKVYDRGVAAWRTGHRPGTTPSQWGYARVNSFVTKSKGTWGKADKDLAAKVRKEETSLDDMFEAVIEAADSLQDKALMALHRMVNSKGDYGSIENYAFDIVRAYNLPMNARELAKKYRTTHGKSIKKSSPVTSAALKRKYGFAEWVEMDEAVNDPSIFKAVFLAGGPGSGKSFIVGKTALPALGFKVINSDDAFERALKKAGLKPTPEDIYSPRGQEIRGAAKALTSKRMELAINGRLGLVIDGTGKDYNKITLQAEMLKKLGYDVAMIFVNTDLDTAQLRNNMRERSLPEDEVTKMWKAVQNNLGKFQNFFGSNFIIVDNSEGSNFESASLNAYRKMSRWAAQPAKSREARDWIQSQRTRKEEAGPCWKGYKQVGMKKKNGKEVPNCVPEEHGAGFRGTSELSDRYAKDTPGQEPQKGFKNKYTEPKAKSVNEEFEELFEDRCDLIGMKQIKAFEKFVDRMFEKFNIDFNFTKHFGDRMSDERNDPCITMKELADFVTKIYKKQGKSLKGIAGAEAVIKDMQTDLNIPVAVEYDSKNDEFDVVMKTIMRKKNFRTPNKVITY